MLPTHQRTNIRGDMMMNETIASDKQLEGDKGDKVIIRHPDFAWIEDPLGFEQHQYHRVSLTVAHIFGVWYLLTSGILLWKTGYISYKTIFIELFFGYLGGLGITVGCHRYWTHKTFKAKMPLQILLMIMQTMAGQGTIYKWCLDHRLHHKYTDTDSDPHNSKRGLLFSHIGWLYLPRHPELQKKRNAFHMPDLENDPIVRFQSRHWWTLFFIFHTALPVAVFYYFFGLPLIYAVGANYRRYIFSLHFTWFVNSLAHKWGDKPYDKSISASQNPFVSLVAVGEGWHNYHHTFPWDYKTSEFGWKINASTIFIDFFAMIGWASEMKTVSQEMLKARLQRTGDGSYADAKTQDSNGNDFTTVADIAEIMRTMDPLWGWDDEEMTEEFRKVTKILKPGKNF